MKVVEAGHEGERLDIGPSLYPVIDERSLAKPIQWSGAASVSTARLVPS